MEIDSNHLSWIAALSVGIVGAFVNFIVARNNRKIAEAQIRNSKILAEYQYEGILRAQNRQDWVNELRNALNEFATQAALMNIEFQTIPPNEQRKGQIHERLTFYKIRITLLLTPECDEEHKVVIKALYELLMVLDTHLLNSRNKFEDFDNLKFMSKTDNIIEISRNLLYHEWKKIQNNPKIN